MSIKKKQLSLLVEWKCWNQQTILQRNTRRYLNVVLQTAASCNIIHFYSRSTGYESSTQEEEISGQIARVSHCGHTHTRTVPLLLIKDTYRRAIFFDGSRSLLWADDSIVLKKRKWPLLTVFNELFKYNL